MPQPTAGDVHVNRPLTNISIAYIQDEKEFVADKVFPQVPVNKQSDRYFKYDKKQWFRTDAQKRAPGTESAGTGYTVDNTPTYYCDVWALHQDVDDQIRQNTDEPLDADRDATKLVTQQQLMRREKQFVSRYFTTGLWTGSSTGGDITPGTTWDQSSADPIKDIDAQKTAMKQNSGFLPNKLVVGFAVHQALKNCPAILDRIKYTQRGQITRELLASLFEVDEYHVAGVTEDTGAEGLAASMSFMFGKAALLCYAAKAPSLQAPSAGYIFTWKGLFGAGLEGARVKKFRMEHLSSDRIESEFAYDMKLVGADLGCFFTGAVA